MQRIELLDSTPKNESDLDWMLADGNIQPNLLAEALVREFFAPIYNLAVLALADPVAAVDAARETFVTALLDAYRYRTVGGVKDWLYSIAIEKIRSRQVDSRKGAPRAVLPDRVESPQTPSEDAIFQEALSALDDASCIVAILCLAEGWEAERVAVVLRARPEKVVAQLQAARLSSAGVFLTRGLLPQGSSAPDFSGKRLDELLIHAFWSRYSPPPDSIDQDSSLISEICRLAKQRAGKRKFSYLGKEVVMLAFGVLAFVGLLWGMFNWFPVLNQQESTPTSAPTQFVTQLVIHEITTTPKVVIVVSTPTAAPLNLIYVARREDSLESIAAKLGIPIGQILDVSGEPAAGKLRAGDRLIVPPPAPLPTPEPAPQTTPLAPLTVRTDPQEILDRMLRSDQYWRTAWVDALVVDYGPDGYHGPPFTLRTQAWAESGGMRRYKERTGLALYGTIYERMQFGGRFYDSRTGSGIRTLSDSQEGSASTGIESLLYPGQPPWFEDWETFRITGTGERAGREILWVRLDNPSGSQVYRLGVDAQTGLVLELQAFGGEGGSVLLRQVEIKQIRLDITLPDEAFDPRLDWPLGFSSDERGFPEDGDNSPVINVWEMESLPSMRSVLPKRAPPPEFDPAQSKLTVQYPSSYSTINGMGATEVEIFTGEYYLRSLPFFANPFSMICSRSSDGNWVAFAGQPSRWFQSGDFPFFPNQVRWFNLKQSDGLYTLRRKIDVFDLAFSPDSRFLAFFGADFSSGSTASAIYQLDLQSGEYAPLRYLPFAQHLAWSPDGRYLAFVGKGESDDVSYLQIIEVETHFLVFSRHYDPALDPLPADAPLREWKIPYPPVHSGLAECTQ